MVRKAHTATPEIVHKLIRCSLGSHETRRSEEGQQLRPNGER